MPAENIYICIVTEAKLTGKMSRCLSLTKLLALRYAPSLKKVLSKQKETLDSSNTVQCNLRTLFWDCYQAGDRERWRKTNSTAVYKLYTKPVEKKNKKNPAQPKLRAILTVSSLQHCFNSIPYESFLSTWLYLPHPWSLNCHLEPNNKTKQNKRRITCLHSSLFSSLKIRLPVILTSKMGWTEQTRVSWDPQSAQLL